MSARTLPLTFLLILGLLALPVQAGLLNELRDHPSPYLAMHGADPVHWQTWGPHALERAQSENKLIFISSGYFACHWCHVMQRESYQNPETAALLNGHFIPVKVDRELQPALDAHLIEFVQRTRGTAGWPLNVFLTPEGHPLLGLTYERPTAFRELLDKLQNAWRRDGEKLKAVALRASEQMAEPRAPAAQSVEDPQRLHKRLTAQALELGDDMEGGFGRQNRFPMAPQLSVLLDRLRAQPNPELRAFLTLTLDQMATQGLRDHLAGGFFRYTVDQGWQIPHFEKMLYTQAQLILLYLKAAEVLQRPDYLAVARDTVEFVIREMAGSDGAYMASFSAVDAAGEEGGNYLWQQKELAALLTPQDLDLARKRWRLEGVPPHEGGYLPVLDMRLSELAAESGQSPDALRWSLADIRAKLLKARAQRELPKDGKQVAAWNGLMLWALAEAAARFDEPKYKAAARHLRDYLVNNLWDGRRLLRARSSLGPLGKAALEDYVYVARGLSALDNLRGQPQDRQIILNLIRQAWKRFYHRWGWRGSDNALLPGQPIEAALPDGPMPSPAAMLIELSLRYAADAGASDLKNQARQALRESSKTAAEQPFWYATHVQVLAAAPDKK